VWPFSLTNREDGFWARKVGDPWEARDPAALALLRALLEGVAMRHSKRQRDARGTPLAQLPPATAVLRPVELSGSCAYIVKYLELLASQVTSVSSDMGFLPSGGADDAAGGGNVAARRRAVQTAEVLLRVLRESCSAPAMPRVTPPPGAAPTAAAAAARSDAISVRTYLREADRLIRAIAGGGVVDGAGGADAMGTSPFLELPTMTAEAALRLLMRRRAVTGSAHDAAAGLVRTDASGRGAYDTHRERAMVTVEERLANASAELEALAPERARAAARRAAVPQLRWQWAGASVCAGRLLSWRASGRLLRRCFAAAAAEARIVAADAALAARRAEVDALLELFEKPAPGVTLSKAAREERAEERADAADAAGVTLAWLRKTPPAEAREALTEAERDARASAITALAEYEKVLAPQLAVRPRGFSGADGRERLAKEIADRIVRAAKAEEDAANQMAFISRLRHAVAAGGGQTVDYKVLAQRGFQDVLQIAEGGAPPDCCICMQPAAQVVVTPCVHIACQACMLAWLRTKAVNERSAVPCPFCRRTFKKTEAIHILPPPPGSVPAAGAAGGAGPSSSAAATVAHASAAIEAPSDVPRFCPAATEADIAAAAAAAAEAATPLLPVNGHFPAVPRLFLTHLAAARAARSPKIAALMDDLLQLLTADATAKAVVFSQLPAAVTHVATLLRDEGIGAVRILAGMPEAERRAAVERFNADASTRVFVLHVGAAAAGLTLTAASSCFMLEPFLCAADEAQAANRCHRIGQTRPVTVITYFTRGTVEERLLAYRAHEGGGGGAAVAAAGGAAGGGTGAGGAGGDVDEAAAAAAAARRKGKGKARAEEEDADGGAEDMEWRADGSSSAAAPLRTRSRRGGSAAAPAAADDDALAMLSADAARKVADGDKLRFLFGLAPRGA
jgi:E3 ubiquitin-protein ligase SHPRH